MNGTAGNPICHYVYKNGLVVDFAESPFEA